jgi:hypothetical protein
LAIRSIIPSSSDCPRRLNGITLNSIFLIPSRSPAARMMSRSIPVSRPSFATELNGPKSETPPTTRGRSPLRSSASVGSQFGVDAAVTARPTISATSVAPSAIRRAPFTDPCRMPTFLLPTTMALE